eukprot:gene8284-biopygen2657
MSKLDEASALVHYDQVSSACDTHFSMRFTHWFSYLNYVGVDILRIDILERLVTLCASLQIHLSQFQNVQYHQLSSDAHCSSVWGPAIELRIEVHHLREAKMVSLNSQFDRSCVLVLSGRPQKWILKGNDRTKIPRLLNKLSIVTVGSSQKYLNNRNSGCDSHIPMDVTLVVENRLVCFDFFAAFDPVEPTEVLERTERVDRSEMSSSIVWSSSVSAASDSGPAWLTLVGRIHHGLKHESNTTWETSRHAEGSRPISSWNRSCAGSTASIPAIPVEHPPREMKSLEGVEFDHDSPRHQCWILLAACRRLRLLMVTRFRRQLPQDFSSRLHLALSDRPEK